MLRPNYRLSAFVFVLLFGGLAHANDASFGGMGAELIPLKQTAIHMRAEEITLEQKGEPAAWQVNALYTFENPSDAAVTVQMGFPETRCDGEQDCAGQGGRFRGIKTTVRGVLVKQRTGTVTKKSPWSPRLGQVYLYDVVFAPHETVEIVHRYTYDASPSVAGETVSYLTRTGTLWNGPIGQARFIIRTPKRPWGLVYPKGYVLASYLERPRGKSGGTTELVFEMNDFVPQADLTVGLGNAYQAESDGHLPSCPSWQGQKQAPEFEKLSKAALRLCRNLPFALHGMPFRAEDLRERFYAKETRNDEGETVIGFRENAAFTNSLLLPDERAWVKACEMAEKRK